MSGSEDRRRLAATFDTVAATYQQVRPDYPAALLGHLLAAAGLRARGTAARDRVRDRQGDAAVGAARDAHHLLGAGPGPGRRRAADAGRLRRRDPQHPVRGLGLRRAAVRPGVRGDRLALDRSGRALPARLRRARARGVISPSGVRRTSSRTTGTRSSTSSKRSTTRSASRSRRGSVPRPQELPDERAEIEAERTLRGRSTSGSSTGRPATTRRATSRCSTPSRGTSTCRAGSETACTARSAGGSPSGPTAGCGGTGVLSSTSRDAGAEPIRRGRAAARGSRPCPACQRPAPEAVR